MLVKPYNLTINLDKPTLMNNVIVKRGDHKGKRLIFNIISNGKAVSADEIYSIAIKATKPDGTIVHDEVKKEDGKVYYDLIEQITAVAGEVECELEIYGYEGEILNSPTFYLTIQREVYSTEQFVSEDILQGLRAYVSAAGRIMDQAQEIRREFENANASAEEIIEQLESVKNEYVTYIDELKEQVSEGKFKGDRGENGANGVIVELKGNVGFEIEDGCLMCYTEE